ncbi:MAG TPA: hypothetical protein VGM32_18780 [Rhodopila sp.]
MAGSRHQLRGGKALTAPLFGIIALLAAYWLLTDWRRLSEIISSTVGAID